MCTLFHLILIDLQNVGVISAAPCIITYIRRRQIFNVMRSEGGADEIKGKNPRSSKQGLTNRVSEVVRSFLEFIALHVSLPCVYSPTLHTLVCVFILRHIYHKVISYDDRNSCSQPKLQNHPLSAVLDWLIAGEVGRFHPFIGHEGH